MRQLRKIQRHKKKDKKPPKNIDPQLHINSPLLQHFYWRRIIVDEAHQVIRGINAYDTSGKGCSFMDRTMGLQGRCHWYVSATPFPQESHVALCANWLDIRLNDQIVDWRTIANKQHGKAQRSGIYMGANDGSYTGPLGSVLVKAMRQALFARSTKDSIGNENYMPEAKESVEYLKLHPAEQAFYDMTIARRKRAQKESAIQEQTNMALNICSNLLDCPTFRCGIYQMNALDDDEGYNIGELCRLGQRALGYKRVLRRRERESRNQKEAIAEELQWRRAHPDQEPRNTSRYKYMTPRDLRRELAKKKTQEKRFRADQPHFNNIYEKSEKYLEGSESAKATDKKSCVAGGRSLKEAVGELGTKMAHMLRYIEKELRYKRTRVIIFSQSSSNLERVQKLLDESKVHAVFCRGNVMCRSKALRAFQDTDANVAGCPRVILLSSENSPAGANLTKATHVVMIDPLQGNVREALANEKQALGRAVRQCMDNTRPCKIVRFIIRDTIEQELYERNLKEMKAAREDRTSSGKSGPGIAQSILKLSKTESKVFGESLIRSKSDLEFASSCVSKREL